MSGNKHDMKITESDLEAARHYLQQQLETHSWWPKEQPGEARHEFTLMKANAVSLSVWCEKWLDSGQLRQLEKALKRSRCGFGLSPVNRHNPAK
jgi:hypothetical protein